MTQLFQTVRLLPFDVQRQIYDFHPNVPRLTNKRIIMSHLQRRYCTRCGEYIDYPLPKRNSTLDPRHIHSHRKKYQKHLYHYVAMQPRLFLHLTPYHKPIMPYSKYKIRYLNDIEIHSRLVFCVRGNRNFYNLRKILRGKSSIPTHMINTGIYNIFHNPNSYLLTDFMFKSGNYDMDSLLTMRSFSSSFHETVPNSEYSVQHKLSSILKYQPHLVPVYFQVMLDRSDMLRFFLRQFPQITVELLSHKKSVRDDVIKSAIEEDIHLLRYFEEWKIKQLFQRDMDWFIELYFERPEARDYISFDSVHILEDTIQLRP